MLYKGLISTIYKSALLMLLLFPPLLLLIWGETNYSERTQDLCLRLNDRDRETLAAQETAYKFRHALRDHLSIKSCLLAVFVFGAIRIFKFLPDQLRHCQQRIKRFVPALLQVLSLGHVTRH